MANKQKDVNATQVSANDIAALQNRVDAVMKEVQYISQQSTAMFNGFEEKLDSFKREFAYLNQQNLSVYHMTTAYVQDALDRSQSALEEKINSLAEALACGQSDGSVIPSVDLVIDHDRIVDDIVKKLSESKADGETEEVQTEAAEELTAEPAAIGDAIDYELLAEKIADNMPPVDYDYLACKIVNNMAATDYDNFAAGMAEKVAANMPQQAIDSELIADSVVAKLQDASLKLDEETLAQNVTDKVVQGIAAIDCENLAVLVADKVMGNAIPQSATDPATDVQTIADSIIERLRETPFEVDVDALAAIVADRMQVPPLEVDFEDLAENIASRIDVSGLQVNADEMAENIANKIDVSSLALSADDLAEKVSQKVEIPVTEIDYDAAAKKILEILPEMDTEVLAEAIVSGLDIKAPETDTEGLADKVAEKVLSGLPAFDAEQVASKVADRIGVIQTVADSDEIALKVADVIPAYNYEEIANRLAEKLNGSEEDVEEYLSERGIEVEDVDSSERVISAVEENSGKTNALVEEVIELLKQKPFVTVAAAAVPEETVEEEPAEEPVQELVDEPAEETEENEDTVEEAIEELAETDAELELSIAEAVAETVAMAETAQELGKTIRLKRSYECKIRQSSDDVKYYYSEIKNELLSYGRVKSSLSWNGDRFNLGRDTIAKININGKTLCLYLALNPDEYSITKYHHKYVGDVKAYESTPMLVKVKSNMGLKKAISLVYEMMESLKAQRIHRASVDYVAEYGYKSDELLIAEGLIKASMTEKKDLNSF